MENRWWVSRFYDVWSGEMVVPPPCYMIQARGETMVVFNVFSREVGLTQKEGG